MNLKILLPDQVFLNEPARKVIAEAANGHFCLLPHHIDFVAGLVPGLLSYEDSQRGEHFVAIDEGVLVKCGDEVMVSTRHAAEGTELGQLEQIVREQFSLIDERERMARSASARLEAGLVRRYLEFDRYVT